VWEAAERYRHLDICSSAIAFNERGAQWTVVLLELNCRRRGPVRATYARCACRDSAAADRRCIMGASCKRNKTVIRPPLRQWRRLVTLWRASRPCALRISRCRCAHADRMPRPCAPQCALWMGGGRQHGYHRHAQRPGSPWTQRGSGTFIWAFERPICPSACIRGGRTSSRSSSLRWQAGVSIGLPACVQLTTEGGGSSTGGNA